MKTIIALILGCSFAMAQSTRPFDGGKWNVSTGNLSVTYIQASPIGAFPKAMDFDAPPTVEAMANMKAAALMAYEDYVAWGAVEREEGKWNWSQHDKVYDAVHKAGLHYVVYNWAHFPPVWLRDAKRCTLMKCLEHNQETNYLSIFDPKTLEYYDRFYKNLAEHFGDKIDGVYACILGPYGEGNYPLLVPDWVKIGHCHEGYWCADEHGLAAFRAAMISKYLAIAELNKAWGTTFQSFDEVKPPAEISEKFKPSPVAFKTPLEKRKWLDFITWYHQAIIDFAERSVQITLKYFPREKVRTKPGGNAGGVNPIAWGTYCPGYAKMAQPYGIVLQPADCQGAVFGDKWVGTAYQFYHVTLSTEPAGGLDQKSYVRRMFSDASAGAAQHFTYEFDAHAPDIRKYIHLYTGQPGETEIAVHCSTTLYQLGGDLTPTIDHARELRDLCEFDVLDELLIHDGALSDKYKVLIMFQPEIVEQAVLDKIGAWLRPGHTLILLGQPDVKNVAGEPWSRLVLSPATTTAAAQTTGTIVYLPKKNWLQTLVGHVSPFKGVDGKLDGLWTCRRGDEVLVYNTTDKAVSADISVVNKPTKIDVAPSTIWSNK